MPAAVVPVRRPAPGAVGAVGVVVPAHDEEASLGACLAALRVAAAHPDLVGVDVRVVVALDACTDGSAAVARTAGARCVEVGSRCVGAARAAGADEVLRELLTAPVLRRARPTDLQAVWLATTDADSRVAPDWLVRQVELADAGADAVLGVVDVDLSGLPAAASAAYRSLYGTPADGHRHVHGASLGVRASAYRAVGGFRPLALDEDVRLAADLRAAGATVVASPSVRVTTSARLDPRARGGFGDLLARLAA